MINALIKGISKALDAEFGDDYEIHMEEIKQGLKGSCFFIQCINPANDLFLGRRYFRTNQFCIQYFPKSNKKESECNSVLVRMFECLEYITVEGDLMRGNAMHGEVVDGVLNFFINFDCFVYKLPSDETPMGDMKSNTTLE